MRISRSNELPILNNLGEHLRQINYQNPFHPEYLSYGFISW